MNEHTVRLLLGLESEPDLTDLHQGLGLEPEVNSVQPPNIQDQSLGAGKTGRGGSQLQHSRSSKDVGV